MNTPAKVLFAYLLIGIGFTLLALTILSPYFAYAFTDLPAFVAAAVLLWPLQVLQLATWL